jgi:hypothetical protein
MPGQFSVAINTAIEFIMDSGISVFYPGIFNRRFSVPYCRGRVDFELRGSFLCNIFGWDDILVSSRNTDHPSHYLPDTTCLSDGNRIYLWYGARSSVSISSCPTKSVSCAAVVSCPMCHSGDDIRFIFSRHAKGCHLGNTICGDRRIGCYVRSVVWIFLTTHG